MIVPVLTIPGLWNSGPQHWQTYWEARHPSFRRVQQRDFDQPDRSEWIANLEMAVTDCATPPVLAAHSLGCSLVGQWAEDCGGQGVLGAFLVAPSDVEHPNYPIEGRSFSYMPLSRLPFPSIVVASTNDVYVSVERARQFGLAGSGWSNQEYVGFLNLYVRAPPSQFDPLVVLIDRNGQALLSFLLADYILVQKSFYLARLWQRRSCRYRLGLLIIRNNLIADINAFIANVYGWTGNQLLNFILRFTAE